MKNISGIVFLSFPFAAGTAASALIAEPFAGALASSLGAVALLCFCAATGRRDKGLLMAAFFFLGCLCWNSHALLPPPPRPEKSHAVLELARLIDRTPFTGENSRAIIKALLTGIRDELPRDTVRIFRESGASHILALSGLHLGIIYLCLKRLLLPLGNSVPARTAGSAAVIVLCGLYALGTGASPSIVRAFLFILIGETGRALSGRRHSCRHPVHGPDPAAVYQPAAHKLPRLPAVLPCDARNHAAVSASRSVVPRRWRTSAARMESGGAYHFVPAVHGAGGVVPLPQPAALLPDYQSAVPAAGGAGHSQRNSVSRPGGRRSAATIAAAGLRDAGPCAGILSGDDFFYLTRCTSSTPGIIEMFSIVWCSSSTECTGKSMMHSTISSSVWVWRRFIERCWRSTKQSMMSRSRW